MCAAVQSVYHVRMPGRLIWHFVVVVMFILKVEPVLLRVELPVQPFVAQAEQLAAGARERRHAWNITIYTIYFMPI